MRSFLAAASVAAVIAACGGGVTSNSDCAPVPLHCASFCGSSPNPQCVNGQWVCPETSNIACDLDSGHADASTDAKSEADAPSDARLVEAGSIACGPTLSCANTTQFCQEASGGPPPPPDSGPTVGYSCEAFPQACTANRTCACLRSSNVCGGALVDCTETNAGITVSCAFP